MKIVFRIYYITVSDQGSLFKGILILQKGDNPICNTTGENAHFIIVVPLFLIGVPCYPDPDPAFFLNTDPDPGFLRSVADPDLSKT